MVTVGDPTGMAAGIRQTAGAHVSGLGRYNACFGTITGPNEVEELRAKYEIMHQVMTCSLARRFRRSR